MSKGLLTCVTVCRIRFIMFIGAGKNVPMLTPISMGLVSCRNSGRLIDTKLPISHTILF